MQQLFFKSCPYIYIFLEEVCLPSFHFPPIPSSKYKCLYLWLKMIIKFFVTKFREFPFLSCSESWAHELNKCPHGTSYPAAHHSFIFSSSTTFSFWKITFSIHIYHAFHQPAVKTDTKVCSFISWLLQNKFQDYCIGFLKILQREILIFSKMGEFLLFLSPTFSRLLF